MKEKHKNYKGQLSESHIVIYICASSLINSALILELFKLRALNAKFLFVNNPLNSLELRKRKFEIWIENWVYFWKTIFDWINFYGV